MNWNSALDLHGAARPVMEAQWFHGAEDKAIYQTKRKKYTKHGMILVLGIWLVHKSCLAPGMVVSTCNLRTQ
jgi:hypothetical protein